jgi:hypothetical protein
MATEKSMAEALREKMNEPSVEAKPDSENLVEGEEEKIEEASEKISKKDITKEKKTISSKEEQMDLQLSTQFLSINN